MKSVGVRELKNRLSEYLRAVRSGESVLVTHHGQVVAELHQPSQEDPSGRLTPGLAALVREGALQMGEPGPASYPSRPRLTEAITVAELLDEERGDR